MCGGGEGGGTSGEQVWEGLRLTAWAWEDPRAELCLSQQILTQEDWNVVLYNGMASTTPWASLYFVALMTFGNYVLFNLLVAILVEGFQAEVTIALGRSLGRGRGAWWWWG